MAQSGYTPISLYYSATGAAVPTAANLVAGELALNTNDGKLYFKNSAGVVTLLAGSTSGPAGGSTTQVQYNNSGVLAGITGATTNGTALTLTTPTIAGATLSGTIAGGGNQINNVVIGTTTPLAGAFTTLSATGKISSTSTGEFLLATSTTQANYSHISTTGGDYYIGINNSTGATLGGTAYAMVFQTAASRVIESMVNTAVVTTVSSTGLAVTGTLSATGTLSGGTSGTGYSFSGSAPAGSLTLNSSGNLGLGVTPSVWSSIYDAFQFGAQGALWANAAAVDIYLSTNLLFDVGNTSKYIANGYASYYSQNNGEHIWKTAPNNTSGAGAAITFTQAMTLDASGNLGIGTTSPSNYTNYKTITVNGTTGGAIDLMTNGTVQGELICGTNDFGIGAVAASGVLTLRAGGNVERARIDASGNLGVGTTTITSGAGWTPRLVLADATAPAMILKGPNSQEVSVGSVNGLFIDCLGSSTGTNNNIIFRNTSVNSSFAASERMRIDTSGIVTMSAYGAGAATFSSAGVISSVSDETWKVKDGVPVDTDAMLKKLSPGYWYYNDEKKETFGTDRQLGFYAQNVNAAIGPEAAPTPETITTKNQDGSETTVTKPWGYYDRSVLAITVMSLQKALSTIETLTARITALETA